MVAAPFQAFNVIGLLMVMVSNFEPAVLNQIFPLGETLATACASALKGL
jgi:hypothetical protein